MPEYIKISMNEEMKTELLHSISDSVARGRVRDTERMVQEAAEQGIETKEIVRNGLVPGMREAGEDFKNDSSDIPRLLCAARAMQKGLETLTPYMEAAGDLHIGKVIIGTVQGDLHEVGKNLVAIMFRGVGFDVIDLGVDVSERQFVKAVQEHPDADIVCLSSLLTTTMDEMRRIVKKLRQIDKEKHLWIMVGGAPVTEAFAKEVGADAYTENAVDAAEAARAHMACVRQKTSDRPLNR